MRGTQIVGVVLLVLGVLALAYRGFSYTKESHDANLGPIHLSVKEKEHVDLPIWAGVAAVAAGAALLATGGRKA
jgi:hypothetical protein